MLQPIMHILAKQRLVLASGSQRRKQILQNVGLTFEVIPSTFEENLDKSQYDNPYDYVKDNAVGKTLEVANRLLAAGDSPDLIIGADTVVTMDGVIYEKPQNKQNAFEMLSKFSNHHHTVYTGVVLVTPNSDKLSNADSTLSDDDRFRIVKFHEATEVQFAELTSEIIQGYIDTDEPMDKAGGYGIQELGGTLVQGIHGDYFNVMGFPLHHFSRILLQMYTQPNSCDHT